MMLPLLTGGQAESRTTFAHFSGFQSEAFTTK